MISWKYLSGIDGFMLVYSVGSKQSFMMCPIIVGKIRNHRVSALLGPSKTQLV